ncbi:uncharacterized protein RSE6_10973 [Rhynchosporium secalis]|uniref:Uncharacterized protein n=1 Tax=Rhynchosporium secalis TaxID=38038 RepID=A0A1E1MLS4_RHYSE|nr:uncharacterized protein RSE6_10973 [Rhynchosporium secalis]
MSANKGHPKVPAWYDKDQLQQQLEEAKQMSASNNKSAPAQRSGHSTPSTRGRGPAMTSTRPMASPSNSYSSYTSTTASRTTHAPGSTRSGGVNSHFSTTNYSVGPSTSAPTFKSPPRQKPSSPIRGTNRPDAPPAFKPKSPPKLRSSILVPGQAQQLVSHGAGANVGGQGNWSSTEVESARTLDPRFMAVKSFHAISQRTGPSYGVHDGGHTANQMGALPSGYTASALGGDQSSGRFIAQNLPPHRGEPIINNWTDDDPKKPVIAGHLRQVVSIAMAECAASGGWTVPEISSDGCSIGGGTLSFAGMNDSIHAPGNAGSSQYSSNFSSRVPKLPSNIAQRSTSGITHGDGDVEMIDGPANTKSSASQSPIDFNILPKLSSAKYAPSVPHVSTKIVAPKSAPRNENKENMKPTPPVQAKDFHTIAKNIVAEIGQSSGSFNLGSNQAAQAPGGFGAAAQNAKSNPFHTNSTRASHNPTNSGFGAPSAPGFAPWGSIDHSIPIAHNVLGVAQHATPDAQVGNSWGPFDQSTSNDQPHYGGGQPVFAPNSAWGSTNESSNNGQAQFGGDPPTVPTGPAWGSVDYSASNDQTHFAGAPPTVTADNGSGSGNQVSNNGQAQYYGAPTVDSSWEYNGHSVSNGHNQFSSAQNAPPPVNAWGPAGQSGHGGQTGFGGTQLNPSAGNSWGSAGRSVQNDQAKFGTTQPAAPAALDSNIWGSVAHPATNGNGVYPGQIATGTTAPAQPTTQATSGWGTVDQSGTNFQHTQGVPGNIQAGHGSATVQPGHSGQGPQYRNVSNAGPQAANRSTMNDTAATTIKSQPRKASGELDVFSIIGNIANDIRNLPSGNAPAKQSAHQLNQFDQRATGSTAAAWGAFNGQKTTSTRPSTHNSENVAGSTATSSNAQDQAHVTAKKPSQQSSQPGQQDTGSTAASWGTFNGQQTAPTRPLPHQVVAGVKKPAGLKESRWAS